MSLDYREILERRLASPPAGWLEVRSKLRHFALINYALPKERLQRYIPNDLFEIPEFEIGGRPLALMSAVPFLDVDFHFEHLFPFVGFRFAQTNYRVYVIHKVTGEHCVWFFGTTLGSTSVYFARHAWSIPWHFARYGVHCDYDAASRSYTRYGFDVSSKWGEAKIELADTGAPATCIGGFETFDEMKLVLTHPVDGYFYRLDGRLGSYSVWHEEMAMTVGTARDLYFNLYERLGLLSREEMQSPHSVFICPEIEFRVLLPPRAVG